MNLKNKAKITVGTLGTILVASFHTGLAAQGRLNIGGGSANYGVHNLQGGFTPDPAQISVTSGPSAKNSVNIADLNLGAGCTGHATQEPDIIVNYTDSASFLRFYVQGSGDTALIVNDPNGNWRCDDDTAGLNPQLDFRSPASGQYDIWVSSYEAGANINATLHVTELPSNQAHN
ncbi:MAG: peptidase S1 [Myxococcota bacterium]